MSTHQRLLFDPEVAPFDPAFLAPGVRGEPLSPERWQPEAMRQRFASPPLWRPEIRADGGLGDASVALRQAAVLIAISDPHGSPHILFTQRTAHLHDHAGQISFPGGRVEAADKNPVTTALRESQEEIGLPPDAVDVLGTLPPYVTATHYEITPVVALVQKPVEYVIDAFEVAEVFAVPLSFLMNPAHHERRTANAAGTLRTFIAMPWTHGRRYFIWGATAAMVRNLYVFLRA